MEQNNNIEVKKDIQEEINEENTGIKISNDVIAVIAGVGEVLSGKKNLAKGIKVDSEDEKVKIDVNIIVEYGTRIPDVAFEIQNRVKKSIENMTGLKVTEVNVHVQGVNIENEKKQTDLEETVETETKREEEVNE